MTDDAEWDRFVDHVRKDAARKIAGSSAFISLCPEGEVDIKFAVELGLAILYGKPIIAIAIAGRPVPGRLGEIADAVVEIADMDTEAGQADLQEKLLPVLRQFGLTS